MDWLAYFDLAQDLAEHGQEAHQRSAVSRAYYAMFCSVRDILDGADDYNPPEGGSQHTYVWNALGRAPYQAEYVGEIGHRLREARRKADYENYIDNLPYLVENAMMDAEELKDTLEALTS